MKTNEIGSRNIPARALIGGLAAAGAERLLMPSTAKAALKIARQSEDTFIKNSLDAANETMKNLGKTFDLNQIAENAKNIYPQMKNLAKQANSSIIRTFALGTIFSLGLLLLQQRKENAQNQKES